MRREIRMVATGRRAARIVRRAVALHVGAAPFAAAMSVVVMFASGIAPVALAWASRHMIDGITAHDRAAVWTGVLGFGLVGGAMAVLGQLTRYLSQESRRRITLRTQVELFAAVAARPGLAELENPRFHDRLRLAQEGARFAPMEITSSLLAIGTAVITVAGFAATLLQWSLPVSGLIVLAAVPNLVARLRLTRLRGAMIERTAPHFRRQAFYSALLLDMRAAKEIRIFGLGSFLRGRMVHELRAAQVQERHQDRLGLRVDVALALLTALVSLAALALFATRVADGQGTAGDLVVVIAALGALQSSLAGVVQEFAGLGGLLMLFEHYADLTASAGGRQGRQVSPVAALREAVEFDDVWFRYSPGHDWVLRGVNLRVPRGSTLAIVGDNGAGKSTLVKLLCGFYTPTRGAVRWDGADIATLDPVSLRQRLSAAFQDFMSYELAARENVAVGDLSALDDEGRVRAAAAVAGVDGTLSALPDGYGTMLSRAYATDDDQGTGVVLSGGEWQRVALARSALRPDADVLLLDEPSSGLDVEAEHEIRRRLTELRRGRTCLLISHRLSTVRDADAIAVLRDGRILEQGTHRQLMAFGGRYATLFRLQASGYAEDLPLADDLPEPSEARG
jgi:ATP-binding cassette, subfamily B, bacterial